MEWSVEDENALLEASLGCLPVGIHRNFRMGVIRSRLKEALNKDISAEAVLKQLNTLLNLDRLESEKRAKFSKHHENATDFTMPDELIVKKSTDNEKPSASSGAPSIIAVAMDNTTKASDKPTAAVKPTIVQHAKEPEKKRSSEPTKRAPKRTRGSMSLESSSPSTTPPPTQNNKRRRI